MRLGKPRIAPLDLGALDAEQAAVLAPFKDRGPVLNIFATMARAPDALKAFLGWGGYILSRRNALSPRLRELAILRTGFLCGSGYEWTQHHRIGLDSDLSAAEIETIKAGADGGAWTPLERAILRACDQLVSHHFVTDATWTALEELGDKGRMDLVFTVGQYTQVSMLLNSFGVQLDAGQTLDPDLDRR